MWNLFDIFVYKFKLKFVLINKRRGNGSQGRRG